MLFSQRYGFKPVRQALQADDMDGALRTSLYNLYNRHFESRGYADWYNKFEKDVWVNFLKRPVQKDFMPSPFEESKEVLFIREWFLKKASWFDIYDFCEFCYGAVNQQLGEAFADGCNQTLEREMSAYRFVDGKITPVTSEVEIASIEQATQNAEGRFSPVTRHLRTALTLLSDRQQPDPQLGQGIHLGGRVGLQNHYQQPQSYPRRHSENAGTYRPASHSPERGIQ